MANGFKKGDVVAHDYLGRQRVGIVHRINGNAVHAFFKNHDESWTEHDRRPTWISQDYVYVPEDADQIWADYCAALLIGMEPFDND